MGSPPVIWSQRTAGLAHDVEQPYLVVPCEAGEGAHAEVAVLAAEVAAEVDLPGGPAVSVRGRLAYQHGALRGAAAQVQAPHVGRGLHRPGGKRLTGGGLAQALVVVGGDAGTGPCARLEEKVSVEERGGDQSVGHRWPSFRITERDSARDSWRPTRQ